MPERICTPEDKIAAKMETEVNGWHIHMREERCRCKDNIFYLNGWEKRNNLWIYDYGCTKVRYQINNKNNSNNNNDNN